MSYEYSFNLKYKNEYSFNLKYKNEYSFLYFKLKEYLGCNQDQSTILIISDSVEKIDENQYSKKGLTELKINNIGKIDLYMVLMIISEPCKS